MQNYMTTIICSPERKELSEFDNTANALRLEQMLNYLAIPFEIVDGFYREEGRENPEQERSYMFKLPPHKVQAWASYMSNAFEQECILSINNGRTSLVFPLGSSEIGEWTEVQKEVAEQQDGWTVIGDKYYTAL